MADLKKELEDAEDEKQKQDLLMNDVKDEKDPMDYFIDKYRPKDFDLVVKIYKENQVCTLFFVSDPSVNLILFSWILSTFKRIYYLCELTSFMIDLPEFRHRTCLHVPHAWLCS